MGVPAKGKWRLHCLPKSRFEPTLITDKEVSLLELVGRSFNLVLARNEQLKEVFLGRGHAVEAETTHGLRYSNGWTSRACNASLAVDVIFDEDAGAKYKPVDSVVAAPLIPAFPDAQLSKNFRLSEFRPGRHAYDYIRISPDLVETLEEIRARAGRPVTVISGSSEALPPRSDLPTTTGRSVAARTPPT